MAGNRRSYPHKPSRCDICAVPVTSTKLRRFSMITSFRREDGRPTSRSCGIIDLCERCWRETMKRHTNPRNRKLQVVA